VQSKNITSSYIIGLIDGIRSPLILAAAFTFLQISYLNFLWVFAVYLFVSAIILSMGHWLTIRSENRSATGEALQKEKEIYQNIGLQIEEENTPHRKPEFTKDAVSPSISVGIFYLLGGALVLLPFLFFKPAEKSLLLSMAICFPILAICGYAKARYYNANSVLEMMRTALLPFIAIGLIYGILQFLK
jgi:VIT1/CCC1 family predicted Fe2+/Mn2+ transporter